MVEMFGFELLPPAAVDAPDVVKTLSVGYSPTTCGVPAVVTYIDHALPAITLPELAGCGKNTFCLIGQRRINNLRAYF